MTMTRRLLPFSTALGLGLVATQVMAMEPLSDEEMSQVQGQANHFVFENIAFVGEAGPNGEPAGSMSTVGTDGSSLRKENYSFTADSIGTFSSPLTLGAAMADFTTNSFSDGLLDGLLGTDVVADGDNLGEQGALRITLPEVAGWQNVDIQYDAVYGNPSRVDANNPNIAAGGTPSADEDFGRVTIDNLVLAGTIDITGIPDGYKIRSQEVQDGSTTATSRQGLMLNVAIDQLSIDRWLLESQELDGVFNPDSDILLKDFQIDNLELKAATLETTPQGYRIAYSDPQPFSDGLPDTGHAAYDPDRPKANLSVTTQMTRGQASDLQIQGMTLDHLVFNVRN
ncbi:hypothetical protein QQM79_09225 [Marinobacteraceae bacterium S3BR75-40.1]